MFSRRLSRLVLILLLACVGTAQAEVLDRIIAVVNGGVILQSELDDAIADAREQIRSRGYELPPTDVLRSQVLDRLVLVKVQTQRAEQAGIRVDDRELNEVMKGIARQNGLSIQQFSERLRSEGMEYLSVREQVREEVLVNRLKQREVDARVVVTDQDVDLYLAAQGEDANQELHLAHILVAIPDGASPEVRKQKQEKAATLLQQARAGEDFSQLAIASSDGQQALQGGDLDWRRPGDLPSVFAAVARRMKPLEVSDIIETSNGYHILKLLGVRGGSPRSTVSETLSRHILIQSNALRTEEEARLQARELYDRLLKGAKFEELAREYSDDPGSKNDGGSLGWLPPGVLDPEFQKQIDSLKPGDITAPFHTEFGWHIATVVDRRVRDNTEEAKRAQARQAIKQRKSAEEYEVWLRRLKDEAYVEYRMEEA